MNSAAEKTMRVSGSLLALTKHFATLLVFAVSAYCGSTQTLPSGELWRYTLLEGSSLRDDCPICGRPTIEEPMRGTFDLALIENNGFFARYELRSISLTAGRPGGRTYRVVGSGEWTIGGEVALKQEMSLTTGIDDGYVAATCYFTNVDNAIQRAWPMMQIELTQTNGTPTRVYFLTIVAAPVRELWFSTTLPFTARNLPQQSRQVSPGDLLSTFGPGHVVKKNSDLTAMLGIQPVVGDYGLDAIDIQPGAEILFSMNNDVWSERLGQLHHGDVLSAKGNIYYSNSALMAAFDLQSSSDTGLDALLVRPDGEIWFSIRSNVISRTVGPLWRGDLLSSRGVVVRSHQQLLSRFHPTTMSIDYGLDAIYVWPSGEIWFSTEAGFTDQQLGSIGAGDLLSDVGAVVFKNTDFVSRFDPAETITDFGLDALFVISDTSVVGTPSRITTLNFTQGTPRVNWVGDGRVFQVESSPEIGGPIYFGPAAPIVPDLFFDFTPTDAYHPTRFYRVRQW